ncbi:MAG TPA: hypothetical protein VFX02_04825 [Gammaproteobacteria bacterium]|nr:hypothetical protein [Gammaproteobacteria bacterium]
MFEFYQKDLYRPYFNKLLRALSIAINETCLYYAGGEKDREREELIAKYWSAAAIPVRHIDSELASMCEHKARYWINPDNWSASEKIETGIKLDRLQNLYMEMPSKRNNNSYGAFYINQIYRWKDYSFETDIDLNRSNRR